MSVPVVTTTAVGCVDSVSPGETGLLVPPGDAVALEDAMRTYLTAPSLRLRHGREGRRWVLGEFRQEALWEALHEQYERLMGLRVPRRAPQEIQT